ncbi:MAG: NAD(P)/FAD-dependent oxidoreductase [Pseudomonadales bacterium]
MSKEIQADYLIVGAGAMGMAFTDTLLAESNATIAIVDRYHQPGGHWTVAYPHVRLHQPSAFYGVNSTHLGSDRIDTAGWNEGLYELATNSEVVTYFDRVMQHTFLPSGRVQYFPNCEYCGEGQFHSTISGAAYTAKAGKIVDATYMHVTVPAMRTPPYEVSAEVHCVPPNELPRLSSSYTDYVVVGAGKTGMDACLFLLRNQVDPQRIRWIMPRDSWMLDRANIQPGRLFAESIGRTFQQNTRDLAEAESIEDAFARVEKNGGLLRLDPDITPSMYRCATVTRAELVELRRISKVIRKGRVVAIEADTIRLEEGEVPTSAQTLHVDCTADGLERRPAVPVFDDNAITLQSVRTCQQVFSAAFIAHVEASYADPTLKNELCTPVPHPDSDIDFLRTTLVNSLNGVRWAEDVELQTWLKQARLDGFSNADAPDPDVSDPDVVAAMEEMGAAMQASIENVRRLLI